MMLAVLQPPLCMIARWNSPTDPGEASCPQTLSAPGGLARDRDVAGVATERGDVAVHPAERGLLVHQPERARARQPGQAEEAEDPQPVVDGDDDERAGLGEPSRVDVAARARAEPAAVDPDEHRQAGRRTGAGRHGDVEGEAVLRLARGGGVRGAGRGGELGAARARRRRGPGARSTGRAAAEGCQRRSPTGGAAYGTPWKRSIDPSSRPSSSPCSTATRSPRGGAPLPAPGEQAARNTAPTRAAAQTGGRRRTPGSCHAGPCADIVIVSGQPTVAVWMVTGVFGAPSPVPLASFWPALAMASSTWSPSGLIEPKTV